MYFRQSLVEESLVKHLTWTPTQADKSKIVKFSLIIFPSGTVVLFAVFYVAQF
jgi:hypothetical protein